MRKGMSFPFPPNTTRPFHTCTLAVTVRGRHHGYLRRLKASQAQAFFYNDDKTLFQLGEIRELTPEPSNRPGGGEREALGRLCERRVFASPRRLLLPPAFLMWTLSSSRLHV